MPAYRYSAHIGYLFQDKPLRERVEAAAAAGFEAVEYPAPYSVPASEMASWLRASGMVYTQFGLYSGDAKRGEKGIGAFSDRRQEFRDSVEAGLDYAETIGVRMVHAMSGVIAPTARTPDHWECYVENLAYAASRARNRGIRILVEPMSAGAVPDYFIATPDRAALAISQAGGENLGLLLDVFHTVSAGLDVHEQIARHAALIAHVHIADYPDRHEPGSATLDFDAIEKSLADAGYAGWLGCEYVPAGQTEAGLGWLADRKARRLVA